MRRLRDTEPQPEGSEPRRRSKEMAENVLKLKKKAVSLGMDKDEAKKAARKVLEAFIESVGKGATKKAAKKTAAKKTSAKKTAKRNSKPASKPKATKTTKATKPKASSRKASSNGDGRHIIGSLDFSKTDGWNPREGSPVAVIFKALKKAKGNVEKATDALMPDVASLLTSVKGQDGKRLGKEQLRNRLKYRVNRTKWEFATRTGQHKQSANRVQYGTGEYAQAKRKPARKASTTKRTTKQTRKTAKGKGKKTAKRK